MPDQTPIDYRRAAGLCLSIALASTGLVAGQALAQDAAEETSAEASQSTPTANTPDDFHLVRRGVDLEETYDLSNITIPLDQIHTLLPRDAIPALTDPPTASLADSEWADDARVVVLEAGEGDAHEVVGVPILVLNWHEIANMTVGGVPVAATYCPLCNSATAIDRRVPDADNPKSTITLEFGVSGALFNSNVLMYDRLEMGLWSQLVGGAVSGPRSGTTLAEGSLVPCSQNYT